MLRKSQVKVGDKVGTDRPAPGYGSEYGMRPAFNFEPGMIGEVFNVDVPWVRKPVDTSKGDSFVVVRFMSPATNEIERAAVPYGWLVKPKGQS